MDFKNLNYLPTTENLRNWRYWISNIVKQTIKEEIPIPINPGGNTNTVSNCWNTKEVRFTFLANNEIKELEVPLGSYIDTVVVFPYIKNGEYYTQTPLSPTAALSMFYSFDETDETIYKKEFGISEITMFTMDQLQDIWFPYRTNLYGVQVENQNYPITIIFRITTYNEPVLKQPEK